MPTFSNCFRWIESVRAYWDHKDVSAQNPTSTKLYGLIGFPLAHSFSKKYFTEKFQRENLSECSYENFPIENISEFLSLMKSYPDLQGLNITIPYKEQVISFLDELD